ncbi:zinc finger, RING/FYVE/PHD-type containing protein [Tanacetum coccineum]
MESEREDIMESQEEEEEDIMESEEEEDIMESEEEEDIMESEEEEDIMESKEEEDIMESEEEEDIMESEEEEDIMESEEEEDIMESEEEEDIMESEEEDIMESEEEESEEEEDEEEAEQLEEMRPPVVTSWMGPDGITVHGIICKNDGIIRLKNRCQLDDCLICYKPSTTHGKHQICCLPCGHMYGFSCIKKWLLLSSSSGKCPQCNTLCSFQDAILLYPTHLCPHRSKGGTKPSALGYNRMDTFILKTIPSFSFLLLIRVFVCIG